MRFTGNSDATLDDQFDSTALLVKGLEVEADVEEEDFMEEEEAEILQYNSRGHGHSPITGY